jgi:hypothetical protein
MAIAVRTISTPARNESHSGAVAYTITSTTAGDLLIACLAWFQGEGAVVTGITGGGTWASATSQNLDANSHQAIWYAHNVTGSVTSITITTNDDGSPAAAMQVTVIHCSGAAAASALDVAPPPTTGTSATPSITSGGLAQADEIVVSVNSHTGADLVGADAMVEDTADGFSEANQNLDNDLGQTFEAQYKVVAATTSLVIGATYNASRAWGAIAASFKGLAAGGGIVIPVLTRQFRQRWA